MNQTTIKLALAIVNRINRFPKYPISSSAKGVMIEVEKEMTKLKLPDSTDVGEWLEKQLRR